MNTSIIPSQIQIFVQTNTGLRAFLIFQPVFRHPEHHKNERKPEQEAVWKATKVSYDDTDRADINPT